MIHISFEEWVKKFRPVMHDGEIQQYPELPHVGPNWIWTVIDTDGVLTLVSGQHYVNRLHYHICEEAVTGTDYYEVDYD